MSKIAMLTSLVSVYMPEAVVKLFNPNRDTYRGEMIDPKAFALGRLANHLRDGAQMPTIAESRAQLTQTAKLFDTKAPALARIEDIQVDGADGPVKARLYSDEPNISNLRPAMIYYHGGGFIQGDLESHHEVCAKLAKWSGAIVVAVDYRLAPEFPYPAGVDDAIAAYQYVVENSKALGVDGNMVGVGGDSAGGCFAAVVAQQASQSGGPVPKFQVLIYPVTDGNLNSQSINELEHAYILPKARMSWYRDQYAGEFKDYDDPKFSPIKAENLSGQPDAYIVTGGFDPLVDDGTDYAKKLDEAGVATVHRHFPGQVHAFVNLTRVVPEGTVALREIAAWISAKISANS